jgi:hypothetical protein
MRHYLSLDIDYFLSNEPVLNFDVPSPLWATLKFISKLKFVENILLVKDHHHILPHINEFKPTLISHVDFHQDIAYPYPYKSFIRPCDIELSCGTFLYFVENRRNIDFVWYYPYNYRRNDGLCVDMSFKPFSKKNFIFKTQRSKIGLPNNKLLSTVNAVGISLSPTFIIYDSSELDRFINILSKRYKLCLMS